VAPQQGWMLRQLSGAESTRSLLSEISPPEFHETRTSVRISWTSPGKNGLRARRPGGSIGEPGQEPHGREWMKDSTGSEEEQAAKVVGNGAGGPKRDWNPATRYGGPERCEPSWDDRERPTVRAAGGSGGTRRTGKWIPRIGRAEGARNPTGGCPERRSGSVCRTGARGRNAGEVLEGDCKVMGGIPIALVTARWATHRNTSGSSREAKDAGGAGKPDERLRRVVRHRRPARHRGGPGREGPGTRRPETGRWQHRNGPE
jgi:hypothetical protein